MNNQIRIEAGYRVHINSIDMNGSLRRACGGIGFSLEEPKIKLVIERVTDEGTYSHEILRNITGVIKRKWGINGKYRIICTSSLYYDALCSAVFLGKNWGFLPVNWRFTEKKPRHCNRQ